MKIKTLDVTQYQDIDAGVTKQNVPWQIVEDATEDQPEVLLLEGNQAFDLSASADEIHAFLSQTLQVYKDDAARHAEASVLQAQLDNASEVAGQVSNLEITD